MNVNMVKNGDPRQDEVSALSKAENFAQMPVWKTYLYHLQQEAPKPKRTLCQKEITAKPVFYGREYHGPITREDADFLLTIGGEGSYLIRESQRAPGQYTLAIRCDGMTKNFKLYYDGQHYVGEKRFDTMQDLVADGLITFYLESKAADYIAALSSKTNYAESPYVAYNTEKKRQLGCKHSSPVFDISGASTSGGMPNPSIANLSRRSVPTPVPQKSQRVNLPVEGRLSAILETRKNNPESLSSRIETAIDESGAVLGKASSISWCTDYLQVMGSEKPHNFKLYTFKGPHWCDYCANFLWGLIAQGVKCQDCGFNAHKKCSEKVPSDCMPDMRYVKRIFGIDLTTLVKARNTLIPAVVELCVQEIESRGLEIEGLYRIAGFHDDVEAIKVNFDKDGENADITKEKYEDINTITSVLKLFFRLLPIPLITFDVYYQVMNVVKKEDITLEEKLEQLQDHLTNLPPAHLHTLKYFMSHLYRVLEHRDKNMMSSENLAIIFAPTLLRSPETDVLSNLSAARYERQLTEILITHQGRLFD